MAIANLIEKKWLWRTFHVVTPEGTFEVVYDGKGLGFEEVLVNGETACRMSSLFWYVPRFDFVIGSFASQINVKVSPLLQISAFDLIVNDELVYNEAE